MSLRVLVVDDHPLYRDGLVTAIAAMPEVDVVGDGRELIGRRPVGAQQRHSAQPQRAVGVTLGPADLLRPSGRLAVERCALALPDRPLVPADPEPAKVVQDRRLTARDDSHGVGVVDPQHEGAPMLVREAAVRGGRERVAEVQRARRAGRKADADAHAGAQASIGT